MIRVQRKLSDYIQSYDDVLDPELCKQLIDAFDANPDIRERVQNGGYPNFIHLDMTLNPTQFPEGIQQKLMDLSFEILERYVRDVNIQFQLPPRFAYENFRIKKYETGGNDRYDDHCDVADYDSARRFMAFFFYLNDVDEGGRTVFTDCDVAITPKAGRCVLFPPTWTFPHVGEAPVSNAKYMVGGYLHYLSIDELKEIEDKQGIDNE